jgi:hypothetical protein
MPAFTPLPATLTSALKEWAVAVNALANGDTILLLRKGGIREQGSSFNLVHRRVWLYPTYEHQKPHLLKPGYARQVEPVPSGWHPDSVNISAWADITHQFQVSQAAVVEALLPFHIWTADFVSERLKWKPRSPLSVLLLRVHKLPHPQPISYHSDYGGCKSWIELQEPLALNTALPVLTDAAYQQQVHQIETILTTADAHDTAG